MERKLKPSKNWKQLGWKIKYHRFCLQKLLKIVQYKLLQVELTLLISIYFSLLLFNTDPMHAEELGLFKREITELYDKLSKENKQILDSRILQMPTVPNFPKISMSLKHAASFKAKHWITISKYLTCIIYGKLLFIV